MKRPLLSMLSCMMVLSGVGQNFDALVSRGLTTCSDVSNDSGLHFARLVEENKLDSAHQLLQYWESKCGNREPLFRAKVLLALKTNDFSYALFRPGTLYHIMDFRGRVQLAKNLDLRTFDDYRSHYAYIPPGGYFDMQTQKIAAELLPSFEPSSMEYILSEFYGYNSDTIFSRIQSDEHADSPLALEYKNEVKRYLNMYEAHVSLMIGTWIPTGRLSRLGPHPEVGSQLGIKHRKMNYDVVSLIKFLKTPNQYYARRTNSDNSVELTNHFFGVHLGIDVGRDLYAKNGHEIRIIGGIAVDGFEVLLEDLPNYHPPESTWSYNFNVGFGYRFYINNMNYLGFRCKYNIVDYTISNLIDYTGNVISFQLSYGFVGNGVRNENLRALRYGMRR